MKRGEIYWVDMGIPVGHEQGGKRPAIVLESDDVGLIVQNDMGNATAPTTIIAIITKADGKKPYPFHVAVSAAESGLSQDSVIKLEHMFTVDKSRLGNLTGHLSPQRMSQVDEAIKWSLGLKHA